MPITSNTIESIKSVALDQIERYGLPPRENFFLTEKKWIELAEIYHANKTIVQIGVFCMDIQLGYAVSINCLWDHVMMGKEFTDKLLNQYNILESEKEQILECVEHHHGAEQYNCIEAEICANADCYRFIHPKWFFLWIASLWKRDLPLEKILDQAEYKLDEKYHALSLHICKQELNPYYEIFKQYIADARNL